MSWKSAGEAKEGVSSEKIFARQPWRCVISASQKDAWAAPLHCEMGLQHRWLDAGDTGREVYNESTQKDSTEEREAFTGSSFLGRSIKHRAVTSRMAPSILLSRTGILTSCIGESGGGTTDHVPLETPSLLHPLRRR